MANEFIARKGLVVLENGARITGSSTVVGDIIASGNVTASNFYGHAQLTGSFTGSFVGDGSQLSGIATTLAFSGSTGSDVVNLKTEALTINGSNGITTTVTDNTVTVNLPSGTVTASSQVYLDLITGTTFSNAAFLFPQDVTLGGDLTVRGNDIRNVSGTAVITFAGTNDNDVRLWAPGSALDVGTGEIRNSGTTAIQMNGQDVTVSGKLRVNGDEIRSSLNQIALTLNGNNISTPGSASAANGFVGNLIGTSSWANNVQYADIVNKPTLVSASIQVDVRDTTGIATIATTGSNTFTGVQTITNTTNSTNYTDGALVVHGGVGIERDVHISGSLTVNGLLTVASMSTAYVTSSQYNIGVSKITLNGDDNVRFSGISVFDSGSTAGSGSLLWDSLTNRWIYENETSGEYNSAIIVAGPKNYGALGEEIGLIAGRVPVVTGDDHIDTDLASSSIYIDFSTRKTYIEAGLYITGSVSSSVGFWGDGSNLTGIVTNLNLTGSQGGTGTVSLKTQDLIVNGTNGIAATVSGQTITISGSNATTSTKGVASFNSTNFTVTAGEVSSNNITLNNGTVTLGGTRNITLQEVTTYGAATTSDQVTLNGGAIIHGVLFTSASTTNIAGPVTNQVVATVPTGSHDSAHFDYVLKDGTNYRTGTVMTVWDTVNGIEYTDTSTNDIGDTGQAVLSVDTNSGNVRLKLTVTSGLWTAKTAIRML